MKSMGLSLLICCLFVCAAIVSGAESNSEPRTCNKCGETSEDGRFMLTLFNYSICGACITQSIGNFLNGNRTESANVENNVIDAAPNSQPFSNSAVNCSVCLEPSADGRIILSNCGHLYCKPCFEREAFHSERKQCPTCNAFLDGNSSCEINSETGDILSSVIEPPTRSEPTEQPLSLQPITSNPNSVSTSHSVDSEPNSEPPACTDSVIDPPPSDAEQIPNSSSVSESNHEITLACTVCSNAFGSGQIFANTCGHLFCESCFQETLAQSNSRCPTCRASVFRNGLYPVFFSNATAEPNGDITFRCNICLDQFGSGQISVSSCGHMYCRSCLEQAVRQGYSSCGVCRSNLRSDQVHEIHFTGSTRGTSSISRSISRPNSNPDMGSSSRVNDESVCEICSKPFGAEQPFESDFGQLLCRLCFDVQNLQSPFD